MRRKVRTAALVLGVVSVGLSTMPSAWSSGQSELRVNEGSGYSKTGKRYTGPSGFSNVKGWSRASSLAANKERPRCYFTALGAVKLSSDNVFVRDMCADGRRVFAEVSWHENGQGQRRRCYNSLGAGVTAGCNFEWSERPTKMITVYRQNSNGTEQMGFGQVFRG